MKQEIWLGCPSHHPQVPTSCGPRPFWRSSTSTACSSLPMSFRRIADGHWTLRTPTPSRSRRKPQSGQEGRSGWLCRPYLTSDFYFTRFSLAPCEPLCSMVDFSRLFFSVLDLSSKAQSHMRRFYILTHNQFAVQGLRYSWQFTLKVLSWNESLTIGKPGLVEIYEILFRNCGVWKQW